MIGADQNWLAARVPFDDAARHRSLPLLDRAAQALRDADPAGEAPLTVVDLGAGTGKSAAWFRARMTPRLPGRSIRWFLADAHEPSLGQATAHVPGAQALLTPLAELPTALERHLPDPPAPGTLLLTCSAVLDVLMRDDVAAVLTTLADHRGLGLFLLSITEDWSLEPTHPLDHEVARAFADHQTRDDKLGASGGAVMAGAAREGGMDVVEGRSPWQLRGPRDTAFIQRFLTERVTAAVESAPEREADMVDWLGTRIDQAEHHRLRVTVDHLDVLIDAHRNG